MSFRKRSLLLFILRGVAFLLLSAMASRAEPESPLCRAIRYRNWPEALRLVEAGAAVTAGAEEFTPLGMLAGRWYGSEQDYELRLQLLQRLIERGADPFARAGTSDNPHLSISMVEQSLDNVDSRLADLLLTNRPSATRRTPTGETALHLATASCRTNVIAALLTAGFSINQTNDDGLTPLQSLVWAQHGWFHLTNDTPPYFQTWIRKGIERTQPPVVAEFLLSRGATLDACSAAGMGMTNQLAKLLRNNPASLNMRDGLGRTPLHYATFNSQTNVATLLTRAGADVAVVTTKAMLRTRIDKAIPPRSSALHFAALREQAEITEMLLKGGASPAQADADGNTPLHLTAHWGATNCSWLLVGARAPLDAANAAGKTPLRIAVESGSFGNVELLLQSGARANTGPGGETLLHVAADKGRPEDAASLFGGNGAQTIPWLLRGGIPVDVRDKDGRTPLHRAVTSLNWKAMNILLTNGADVNAADNRGNTALHQLATKSYDLVQYENTALRDQWMSTNRFFGQQQVSFNTLTNTSVTAWLLEHGAKPAPTNYDGKTPLDLVNGHRWAGWESEQRTKANRIALLQKAMEPPEKKTPGKN